MSRCHFESGYTHSVLGHILSIIFPWLSPETHAQLNTHCPGNKGPGRKLDFFGFPDVLAYGRSLSFHPVLSITLAVTKQQHKAIRAVEQMDVMHAGRCAELQSNVPLHHF